MEDTNTALDGTCSNESTDTQSTLEMLSTEEMEDLYRIECRRWLLKNGDRLFHEKLRLIVEPDRRRVKAKIMTDK